MLALACSGGASPRAASVEDTADSRLERTLGSYSDGVREWVPSDRFLVELAASDVPDHPDVWTDGSFVLGELENLEVTLPRLTG